MFIVSEEDIIELICMQGFKKYVAEDKSSNFLKSKQEVELVTEGWFVHLADWFKNWHDGYKINNPHTNKEFKIYIEEQKHD